MQDTVDLVNQYDALKNSILISSCSQSGIGKLKILYNPEINSNRTSAKINNIQDLIKILEKRDFLNKDNINCLIKIRAFLELELTRANSSNRNIQGSSGGHFSENIQIVETIPRVNKSVHNIASTSRNFLSAYDQTAKRKVYKIITTEIGKRWMNFGRILKVKEHTLDELASNYSSIEERVYKILQFHEEDCDPTYWKSKLLDGLVEARRQDLKKKVQDIFDVYSAQQCVSVNTSI